MEQIIIRVKDKFKAKILIELLNDLDFVSELTSVEQNVDTDQEIDFFSFAGIWADRDVSLQSIRQKAWPSKYL